MTSLRLWLWLPIAIGLLWLTPAPVLADDDDEVVPGEVVVKLIPDADPVAFANRYRVTLLDQIPTRRTYLYGVPVGDEEEFVDIIEFDPDVELAQPCFTGRDVNPDAGTQSIFVASTYGQFIDQYAMTQINVNAAQTIARGAGVTVAVLDSGIDAQHPALAPAIAPGGWNFIDDNTDLRDRGDGIDNDGDDLIDEAVGHGTLVAGLIRRVAPESSILPLKVLDSDGFTTTWRMVEAIYYAIDAGVPIINLSMGTTEPTFILYEAMLEARTLGVLIVACTGNEDTSSPLRFPAAHSNLGVIAVSATDRIDRRAEWSNFGEHVSLCAPGVDITSTIPGGGYGRAQGTSFAAPMIAATAALLLSQDNDRTPPLLRLGLFRTAEDITDKNPGYEMFLGAGRLDAGAALRRNPPPIGDAEKKTPVDVVPWTP